MTNIQTRTRLAKNPWLKLVLELGPLGVFFLMNSRAYLIFDVPKEQNIFYATGCFMVATLVALAVSYALLRKIPTMPLVTGVFVVILGGLTLWLHNDEFIKLKPTLTNLLFAGVLLSGYALGKPVMRLLFDSAFNLTYEGWMILTRRWGFFFIFLAIVNEIVWRNFSTDFWVGFKLFGIMPITFIFAACQMPVLTRHVPKDTPEQDAA
ncbi:MAG: septation protein A [Parvibaculaceae bacterium]|nr:septation protein A [Parvibaculaceae bacterium]